MPSTTSKFQLREANPTCAVLTCQGSLSWEDRELLAHQVQEYLQHHPNISALVADVGAVDFVNSAGLGALFQLNRRLCGRGGQLLLANVPPQLLRVFRAIGLDRIARVEPDVETAVASLAAPDDQPAGTP